MFDVIRDVLNGLALLCILAIVIVVGCADTAPDISIPMMVGVILIGIAAICIIGTKIIDEIEWRIS